MKNGVSPRTGPDERVQAHDHHDHDHGSGAWDDATAEWYVKHYGDHPTNRMTVELAELAPDDVVVDVGCGSGEAVREAASRVPHGRAIGVDPTPAMIRFAEALSASHEGHDRIQYLEGPAENLPLPGASATAVLAINSLHHWQDAEAGLAEVIRVLKPGGRLFVADEEPTPGQFGHTDGQLADPAFVVRTIEGAGFVDVALSKHAQGRVSMLMVAARKEAR
jgi:SAM-dependent methyltransferase